MADETALTVEVSPDRLAAIAKCDGAAFAPDEFADAVLEAASRAGITEVHPREELTRMFEEHSASQEEPMELIFACGTAPIPPTEAKVDWAGEFFSHDFVIDPVTGAINYRQHRSNPSVAAGQRLLTVIPPIPGTDGVDVHGKRIPTKSPKQLRIRAGKNVSYIESTNSCVAEKTGRVRFVGNVLSVDDVYTVTGDVGLITGNIEHPGTLEVLGNIEADSLITCTGHVTVRGYIEAADVESGGDVEVKCGVFGVGMRPINAAGSLWSKFIIDSETIAGVDVCVAREIVHSIVSAGERVLVPEGRIVGGRVYGRHRIDVRDAGSPGFVPTLLAVGRTEQDELDLRAIEQRIEILRAKANRIRDAIEPLVPTISKMGADEQKAIHKLSDSERLIREEVAELEQDLEDRRSPLRPSIIIRSVIYPETTICIDQVRLKVREALAGPLVARRTGEQVYFENARVGS